MDTPHDALPAVTPSNRNALFGEILSIASDAIISVDEEQRIWLFSHGAEQMFGYEGVEVLGQRLDILLPERFREAHRGHIVNYERAGGEARRVPDRAEITGLRKDGEEFPAEASISMVEVDGRRAFTVVLRDVSEQSAAFQLAREHLKEARRSRRLRDRVLAAVSHDLGTPSSIIAMFTKLLERRIGEDEVAGEYLDAIREANQQMLRLIQDLSAVSAISRDHFHIVLEPVGLKSVVDEVERTLFPLAVEAGIEIGLSCPETVPLLLGDKDRILQVLQNLWSNAVKFTPRGGRIGLGIEVDGDRVRVELEDTGCGMSAEQLETAFEWFETHAGEVGKTGTGLGLAIAREIVELHGGTLEAESVQGEGSTFRFTLPVAEPPEPRDQPAAGGPEPGSQP